MLVNENSEEFTCVDRDDQFIQVQSNLSRLTYVIGKYMSECKMKKGNKEKEIISE